MKEINDGGPAFPVAGVFDERKGQYTQYGSEGLSKRDYFAAKAMQALAGKHAHSRVVEAAYQIADAMLDDATVRKWRGFTVRNGGHRFIVGNVFAFRSTDPDALKYQDDPFGPLWLEHLNSIIAEADVLVPCWGRLNKTPKDLRGAPAQLLASLIRSGKPVLHFGVTGCGQPKHPLMLGYDTPLTPWGATNQQRSS